MRCRECNERIVQRSEIYDVCACCYVVLDLDRHKEARVLVKDEPVDCERCRDTGKILVRGSVGSLYMYARPCTECGRGTK